MAEPPKDTQKELEREIGELEERVDRLRASYEQYFMGFEKIEPSVQRKDVDRRFTHLRKTQIRNTALRFRFNVVTQKFNTYAMYWTRVCRQIEEGTFKRHVQRATRRFGPGADRRRDDFSIDVELGDFEEDIDNADLDMEAVLAEANAHAETFNLQGGDTLPPSARTDPPQSRPSFSIPAAPSSTAFAMTGQRETIGSEPPDSTGTPRPLKSPRQVALPPGAKPRVQLRKRDDHAPPSTRHVTAPPHASIDPPTPPQAMPPPGRAMRPPIGSQPDRLPPPSSSVIRPSPVTADPNLRPDHVPLARPGSVNRVPVATPPGHQRPMIRPAIAKQHTPASPMTPPGSDGAQKPAPAPSVNRVPIARPPTSPGAPPPRAPGSGAVNTPGVPMKPAIRPIPPPSGAGAPQPRPLPASVPRIAPASGSGPASTPAPTSDVPRPTRRPPPALPSKHSQKKP